jgi:hypothetical protein
MRPINRACKVELVRSGIVHAFGPTYIHCNRKDHELGIEANEGSIFGQAILLHKPLLDGAQEVIVQSSVDNQDQNFGDLIPVIVDPDKCTRDRWYGMCWDPDDEDGNVDAGDESNSAPLQSCNSTTVLGDQGNSVDDNLHQELDFEHP